MIKVKLASMVGLLCSIMAFSFPSNVNAKAEFENIQPPHTLIKALQSGGHIMYMRHEKTIRKNKQRDSVAIDFSQCESQRNLSEQGIESAQNTGKLLKQLTIPVGAVKSSPYCRAKDTAALIYGDYEIDEKLAFSIAKEEAESDMLGKYLKTSMLASNDRIKNTVFVGHTANLKDGLGVWPKPEGVVVVFKKEGDKIIYKGMIKPTDWASFKP